ncbi:MAG TPA: nucleotide exchange factor GrpE [Vitreimonas sp.]|nr:nucleotide exchange factor GrpE [Vitreimonas sp.]
MKNQHHSQPPEEQAQDVVTQQLENLQTQLQQAQESEKRILADYQNLVRRQQEERGKLVKMATQDFVENLLQPLDHLSLAATQLQDKGLNMVVQQFWQTLNNSGLTEFNPVNETFDPQTMEVVDKQGDGDTVTQVMQKGYKLNGELIRVAKVIVA